MLSTCYHGVVVDAATREGLLEPDDVNVIAPVTDLGLEVAAYFNLNIADLPSMWITGREGEALAQFVVAHT